MSNEELSYADPVQTTYQETELPAEWDENARDTGEAVVEARSYHVLLVSRTGTTVVQPTTSVTYRPRHSAAHGFRVSIEPDTALHTDEFITGDAVLFADGEALQVGAIEEIEYNQNDDDYTIKARAVGYQIEEQVINRTATNEVVEDVLAKSVHEYNEVIGTFDDLFGTFKESTNSAMKVVGGDIYALQGNFYGEAVYTGLTDDSGNDWFASDLDVINFKAYTPGKVTVRITTASETYDEEFHDLTAADYGEWVEMDVPALPDETFELKFELWDEGSFLYAWNALAESKVRTQVDPLQVQTVEEDVFAYSRSGQTLRDETAQDSNGDPIVSPGVIWDDSRKIYRPRRKATWYIFSDDQVSGNTLIDSDDGACQGAHRDFTPGGATFTTTFTPEDEAREWKLRARVAQDDANTTNSDGAWTVTVGINGSTESYNINPPPPDTVEWVTIAEWDYFSAWPDNSKDLTLDLHTHTDSEVSMLVDCFCFTDGPTFNNFDNVLNEAGGQLDSPHLYGDGYVEFTSSASADNITSATVDTPLFKSGEPVARWGPRQRTDQDAPWEPVRAPNSSSTTDVFNYPGVNHGVRVHLAAQGDVQNDTPRYGWTYAGMDLSEYSVSVDSDDLELFSNYDLSGNRLEVLSSTAKDSSHVYRWEGNRVQIFKQGSRKTDVDLLQAKTTSSVSDLDVYSSVEVIGDGVTSGVIHAPNPPQFVDRHKEIRDPDITTRQDALRRASSFIVKNSTLNYSGEIRTLPTPVPVGEMLDGQHFTHGKDSLIESANYSQKRTTIQTGFERRFSDQFIDYSEAQQSEKYRSTNQP